MFYKHLGCVHIEKFAILYLVNSEVLSMCDVKKYSKIYQEIKELQPEDTLQLILEAEDKEEKDFFEMVGNFLLQQKQKKVIQGNLF